MTNLNERLDRQLRSIKEDSNLNQIIQAANKAFDNGEAPDYRSGRKKALELLTAVAKADAEGFQPNKVRIDIKKLTPDPKEYTKEVGSWDGGDDEDYFICHFDYDGNTDILGVGKKFLSSEAYKYLKSQVAQIVKQANSKI